jgi:glutaredoxin
LFTRQGCPLCDEALHLLRRYQGAYRLQIDLVDIDRDPCLVARYGDQVPVVALGGRPRLWGRLNEVWLRRLLRAESLRASQAPPS